MTVDMAIVAPNELATITQTRLAANDVDVVDIFAFNTAVQPYMTSVTPPIWQTLVDAGSLLDITDQPFVANYDPAAIRDAGTYNDKVYAINLARVGFSGLYVNNDLFAEHNVAVPTTWSSWSPPARHSRRRTCRASPPVARPLADLRDRLRDPWLRVPRPGRLRRGPLDRHRSSTTTRPTSRCGRSCAILAQEMIEPGCQRHRRRRRTRSVRVGRRRDAVRLHLAGARHRGAPARLQLGSTSRSRAATTPTTTSTCSASTTRAGRSPPTAPTRTPRSPTSRSSRTPRPTRSS